MQSKPHNGDGFIGRPVSGVGQGGGPAEAASDPPENIVSEFAPARFPSATAPVTPLELARVIERVGRRFLDHLRLELTKLGTDDVSPAQVMILLTIGQGEIAVRDLLDRGNYAGSNASYNLKQLVDSGYLERGASPRDRRLARLSLSLKGQMLCEKLRMLDEANQFGQGAEGDTDADLKTTYETLRRLEQWWSDSLRYGGAVILSCTSYSFIGLDLASLLI